jgi:hypothetical protein
MSKLSYQDAAQLIAHHDRDSMKEHMANILSDVSIGIELLKDSAI